MTTKQLIVPCVHNNGTGREALLEQLEEVSVALDVALNAMGRASPNGRDYYPYGNSAISEAVKQHRERYSRIAEVQDEIQAIVLGIHDLEKYVEVKP